MSMDFDKQIKELFEAYSEQPSMDCWTKLSTQLDAIPTPDASSAASAANTSTVSQFVSSVAGKITIAVASTAFVGGLTYWAIFSNDSVDAEKETQTILVEEQQTFTTEEFHQTTQLHPEIIPNNQKSENNNITHLSTERTKEDIPQVSAEDTMKNPLTTVSNPDVSQNQSFIIAPKEILTEPKSEVKTLPKENHIVKANENKKEEPQKVIPSNDILQQEEKQEEPSNKIQVQLQISSYLSPNGDGHNDFFIIKDIEQYPQNKLSVFRRDCVVIYEKNNYQNDWTAENIPDGVYYYIFTFVYQGQSLMRQGSITIKR